MLKYRIRRITLSIGVVALLFAPEALAQGSVSGWVTSQATKDPVVGGRVMLVGTSVSTCTGLDGRYVMTNIAPGTVQVRILAMPYMPTLKTVNVTDAGVATLDIELAGAPVMMAGGRRPGPAPTASQSAVKALFKDITLHEENQVKADAIYAKAFAARRAADPKSPDYLGTLGDIADKRNADLKALLTSDADKAAFAENLGRNPDTGCAVR